MCEWKILCLLIFPSLLLPLAAHLLVEGSRGRRRGLEHGVLTLRGLFSLGALLQALPLVLIFSLGLLNHKAPPEEVP